jgi:hypothetical protein
MIFSQSGPVVFSWLERQPQGERQPIQGESLFGSHLFMQFWKEDSITRRKFFSGPGLRGS